MFKQKGNNVNKNIAHQDALEVIKNVKEIFELSTIEEVILGDSGK